MKITSSLPIRVQAENLTKLITLELITPLNNSFILPSSRIIFNITTIDPTIEFLYNWDARPNQTSNLQNLTTLEILAPSSVGQHVLTIYTYDNAGFWIQQRYVFTVISPEEDLDNDGLTNAEELDKYFTNPVKEDTDDDGLLDEWEIKYSLNPLDPTDASEDSDGDGLINLAEHAINTNPRDGNDPSNPEEYDASELKSDADDDLTDLLVSGKQNPSDTWIIGSADQQDSSDWFFFSFPQRTNIQVMIQAPFGNFEIRIFDLEYQINITRQLKVIPTRINQSTSTIEMKMQHDSPYQQQIQAQLGNLELDLPFNVETLVVEIKNLTNATVTYSFKVIQASTPSLIQIFSPPFLLGATFFVLLFSTFILIRLEYQKRDEINETDGQDTATWKEWTISSMINAMTFVALLWVLVELSMAKFLNTTVLLSPEMHVLIGYGIIAVAIASLMATMIIKNAFSRESRTSSTKSLTTRIFKELFPFMALTTILSALFLGFFLNLARIPTNMTLLGIINVNQDIVPRVKELLQIFFKNDLHVPLTSSEQSNITRLALLEITFVILTGFILLLLMWLSISQAVAIQEAPDVLKKFKKASIFKKIAIIVLEFGVVTTIIRIFASILILVNHLLNAESLETFIISLPRVPWWYQPLTIISQATNIPSFIFYGAYFGLQGIFFVWVLFRSQPQKIKHWLNAKGFSGIINRVAFCLIALFAVFIRTIHFLVKIPIGIPTFSFSIILSKSLSILLMLAMTSEIIENIAFLSIVGLVLAKKLMTTTTTQPEHEHELNTELEDISRFSSPNSSEETINE